MASIFWHEKGIPPIHRQSQLGILRKPHGKIAACHPRQTPSDLTKGVHHLQENMLMYKVHVVKTTNNDCGLEQLDHTL